MSFANFYQSGGVLMHLVTILSIAGVVMIARRIRRVRSAFADPSRARGLLAIPDSLTVTMIVGALATGLLATCMGWMEAAAAVSTVPPEMQFEAWIRGNQILIIPMVWALMCSIPLVLGHGGLRHFETRLRAALDEARA
jgi:hypothetical protein